jgi:hypothetical protein
MPDAHSSATQCNSRQVARVKSEKEKAIDKSTFAWFAAKKVHAAGFYFLENRPKGALLELSGMQIQI